MLGNGFFIFRKMGKKVSDSLVLEMHGHYKSGMSTKEVGAIYGVTGGAIQSLFKRVGLATRNSKRYDFNRDYFSSIDTPVKAYIVGFLAADGGLDEKAISVKVSIKDVSILELIKKEVGSEVPIKYRKGRPLSNGKYIQSDYCYIRLSSKKMLDDLIAIGVTPKKSLTLEPPKDIPEKLIKYFILGYFDGDGTINNSNPKNPRFSFLGTKEFLLFISKHLVVNAGMTVNNLYNKGNFWQLSWGGSVNAIKFREYMYDTSDKFSFQRKRDKFFTVNTVDRVYKKGRTVSQYDLHGVLIKDWIGGVTSIVSSGFKCGRNIYEAVQNPSATAYGFKWAYK